VGWGDEVVYRVGTGHPSWERSLGTGLELVKVRLWRTIYVVRDGLEVVGGA